VDKDRIRICIPEVTRPVIGKLLEHVKALSGPESPTGARAGSLEPLSALGAGLLTPPSE
jgi:hypothetical protein